MHRMTTLWILPILLLVIAAFGIQFHNPSIIGADGYLHGRMALMIARGGFLQSLPEAHFSWFADRFSDKDVLYHVYLIPFVTVAGYIAGTKLAAALATTVLFTSVGVIMFLGTKKPFSVFISLGLLLSSQFLRDTAEARPVVWAITMTIWGIYAISKDRSRPLFFISLLFGMTHLSAWVLPLIVVMVTMVDWIQTGKARWQPLGASSGGYALSFLLHPNFPTNIFYTYLNGILVPWYAAKTGVLELGAEFFPLYTSEILRAYPILVAGTALIFLLILTHSFRPSRQLLAWFVASIVFGLLGFVAQRNLTHAYPVFLITLAQFIAEWSSTLETNVLKRERMLSLLIPAVFVVVLGSALVTAPRLSQSLVSDGIWSGHYALMARVIEQKIPRGSRIFHANWSDSQYFIGLAPEYQYLVTFDPIYMYSYDPELYALYRRVSHGESSNPVDEITHVFGSYYVYASKIIFLPFVNQLKGQKDVSVIAEDDLGTLFQLPDQQRSP